MSTGSPHKTKKPNYVCVRTDTVPFVLAKKLINLAIMFITFAFILDSDLILIHKKIIYLFIAKSKYTIFISI